MTLADLGQQIVEQRQRRRELQSRPHETTQAALADIRDQRDPARLGGALLGLRRRAPKAKLSALYDRHFTQP